MAQGIVLTCLALDVIMEKSKMSEPLAIEYEVLFDPSQRYIANAISRFAARDILYKCPECDKERVFPDVSFDFVDECCGVMVVLIPKEEE